MLVAEGILARPEADISRNSSCHPSVTVLSLDDGDCGWRTLLEPALQCSSFSCVNRMGSELRRLGNLGGTSDA